MVSRLLTPIHDSVRVLSLEFHFRLNRIVLQRLCTYRFPEVFHKPVDARTNVTNTKYHGWKINEPRLFFANGHRE
jgi:hypothetical protein